MKYLSTFYKWVLLLPVFLPLLFIQGMMYPLMTPKILALRALGILALALFVYLALAGKPFFWKRLREWSVWVPGALLVIAYLTSYLGIDFYHSFWSTFERGDGLLTLSVITVYFYLIILSVDKDWISKLITAAAWTGSISAVYLIIQWFAGTVGVDIPFIVESSGRVGGTMGNAAFLAAYLGMTFFAALAAGAEYQGNMRRLLYAGAGLHILAILLTATRGTILALLAVGGLALLYLAIRGATKGRLYARLGLASFALLAGLFFLFRTELSEAPFEPIRRMASISFSDSTVASRLFIWENVAREALSRPLLGYGAEHIDIPFDKVYDPSAMEEEWFDRSHNAYLDYFVQFGFLGAMLYIALIGLLIRQGFLLHSAGSKLGTYILGLAGVYAIQNFFVFDTAMTFWLFAALLAGAVVKARPDVVAAPFRGEARNLGIAIGLGILLLVIPVVIQPLRANLLAFQAYLYQVSDVRKAHAAVEKGMALNTYADLELGYNAYFMYTEEQLRRLTGEDLKIAYENATELLAKNFKRYPYDVRTGVYLIQVLSAAPEGESVDKGLLSEALATAIDRSPKRDQPWYILANLSIREANLYPAGSPERREGYAAVKDILEQYISRVPELSKPYFVMAQLEHAGGNDNAAKEAAEKGKTYYAGELETARRAVLFYESVMDLPNARYFLKEVLRMDPSDENARYDLSQIESMGL